MKLIKQLLDAKGRDVLSISPDASVLDAIKLMAEKQVGALLVMSGDHLTGIVTERDYARKVILKDRSSHDTRVSAIMSGEVLTAAETHSVQHCMNEMTNERIRHLPVLEGDRVVGLISIGDLVKAVIADQQAEIEQLGQYISG